MRAAPTRFAVERRRCSKLSSSVGAIAILSDPVSTRDTSCATRRGIRSSGWSWRIEDLWRILRRRERFLPMDQGAARTAPPGRRRRAFRARRCRCRGAGRAVTTGAARASRRSCRAPPAPPGNQPLPRASACASRRRRSPGARGGGASAAGARHLERPRDAVRPRGHARDGARVARSGNGCPTADDDPLRSRRARARPPRRHARGRRLRRVHDPAGDDGGVGIPGRRAGAARGRRRTSRSATRTANASPRRRTRPRRPRDVPVHPLPQRLPADRGEPEQGAGGARRATARGSRPRSERRSGRRHARRRLRLRAAARAAPRVQVSHGNARRAEPRVARLRDLRRRGEQRSRGPCRGGTVARRPAAETGGCCTTRTCRRRTSSTTFTRLPLDAPPTDDRPPLLTVRRFAAGQRALELPQKERADATTALRPFPEAERRDDTIRQAERTREYGRGDENRVAFGREPRELGCHYSTSLLRI